MKLKLRAGCQWKALPKKLFGSASAIHKRFLVWDPLLRGAVSTNPLDKSDVGEIRIDPDY